MSKGQPPPKAADDWMKAPTEPRGIDLGPTLRDRFAMAALKAVLEVYTKIHVRHVGEPEVMAADAYAIADAMLLERERAKKAAP